MLKKTFLGLFRNIANILGQRCPFCGRSSPSRGPCPRCADELAPRLAGFCPDCGAIYENRTEPPTRCFDCRDDPRPWSALTFHSVYGGALRKLILRYKFQGSFNQSRALRCMLREAYLRANPGGGEEKLVVPIPLHPRRLIFRGFNQSLELARALSGIPGLQLCPAGLRRTRHTTPQAGLKRVARMVNLKGAFEADPNLVAGKIIVLVDDVMTTGSTLEFAAKALLRAGAQRIECLVLARG